MYFFETAICEWDRRHYSSEDNERLHRKSYCKLSYLVLFLLWRHHSTHGSDPPQWTCSYIFLAHNKQHSNEQNVQISDAIKNAQLQKITQHLLLSQWKVLIKNTVFFIGSSSPGENMFPLFAWSSSCQCVVLGAGSTGWVGWQRDEKNMQICNRTKHRQLCTIWFMELRLLHTWHYRWDTDSFSFSKRLLTQLVSGSRVDGWNKGGRGGVGPEAQASGVNRCVGSLPCWNGSSSRCTAAGCGSQSYIPSLPACVEILSYWERGRGVLGGVTA